MLRAMGKTDFNAGSRMQGQLDSALTELGPRARRVAAAEVLSKLQPLLIVSSDLHRAYDTAVKLGGAQWGGRSRSMSGCARPTSATGKGPDPRPDRC